MDSDQGWDETAFVDAFRAFHQRFSEALDAGVDIGALLAVLEREGVQLPDFVRMML